MKTILLFVVTALAVQAQTPVHNFFYNFISNLNIEATTKNYILNSGLECIDSVVGTIVHSIGDIEQDLSREDFVHIVKETITSMDKLEHEVFPQCDHVVQEFNHYMNEHFNIDYLNSTEKSILFIAVKQKLFGEALWDAFGAIASSKYHKLESTLAKDLADLFNVATGLVQADLPEVLKRNWDNHHPFSNREFTPAFFKGLFNALGFDNLAQINATAQCVLDIHYSMRAGVEGYHYGEMSKFEAYLNIILGATEAFERCKRLDMVDLSPVIGKYVDFFKREPVKALLILSYLQVHNLPMITKNALDMDVLVYEGQYEAAGQRFAEIIKAFEI